MPRKKQMILKMDSRHIQCSLRTITNQGGHSKEQSTLTSKLKTSICLTKTWELKAKITWLESFHKVRPILMEFQRSIKDQERSLILHKAGLEVVYSAKFFTISILGWFMKGKQSLSLVNYTTILLTIHSRWMRHLASCVVISNKIWVTNFGGTATGVSWLLLE